MRGARRPQATPARPVSACASRSIYRRGWVPGAPPCPAPRRRANSGVRVETRPSVAVHNASVPGTHESARELAHGGSADAECPVERRSFRSLDQTESVESTAVRPDSYAAAASALAASHGAIPRGQGLSYCLASAGEGSTSILTSGLDRILHVDADARTIEVEAGLTLGELASFAVSKGLWFPVLPGYPTITVGGALGMNVHGK